MLYSGILVSSLFCHHMPHAVISSAYQSHFTSTLLAHTSLWVIPRFCPSLWYRFTYCYFPTATTYIFPSILTHSYFHLLSSFIIHSELTSCHFFRPFQRIHPSPIMPHTKGRGVAMNTMHPPIAITLLRRRIWYILSKGSFWLHTPHLNGRISFLKTTWATSMLQKIPCRSGAGPPPGLDPTQGLKKCGDLCGD